MTIILNVKSYHAMKRILVQVTPLLLYGLLRHNRWFYLWRLHVRTVCTDNIRNWNRWWLIKALWVAPWCVIAVHISHNSYCIISMTRNSRKLRIRSTCFRKLFLSTVFWKIEKLKKFLENVSILPKKGKTFGFDFRSGFLFLPRVLQFRKGRFDCLNYWKAGNEKYRD